MKHLNDKTIQNHIDNELPENDRKTVKMHLDECPSCRQRVEAQRAFSEKMKKSLETLVPDEIAVPEFSFRRTARPEMNVTRIALISSLATACSIALIALIVNLLPKPKPANRIIDFYTIEDYDANKPYAEQEFAEFKMRSQTEETNINL
ncbi:MAG: zf-HC2 domain-containing protein [Bacteroidales bacterium]|nr:zf-HC2 domain-containing protein [Bacteroidales bacterium]